MTTYRVVIPAGGRSSRSGLQYPKTLHRLAGIPILIRICRLLAAYDLRPVLIINPAQETHFREVLSEFGQEAELVFQAEPKGMGNAILQADAAIAPDAEVILVWSDIPLLSPDTIRQMLDCHSVFHNDFTLVTAISDDCYTIVQRDNGRLQGVVETRALGIAPQKGGERDIGLFVFRKQLIFDFLQTDIPEEMQDGRKEHGFLYLIERLATAGKRVEGYPLALPRDLLSFNTPEDLQSIERYLGA
jgi:bifunctional UDP-N-acetylglucosamine pyrophosphorylase / glucosamine-1-phosphate N-acetyltransferase